MIALECENISKSFQDNTVLDNLSFEIEKGEFVTIIGKSGSGKSTLLDILNNLIDSDSGKTVSSLSMSTVFQNYEKSLYPHLTALQNVMLPFEKQGKEVKDKCLHYLGLVGLSKDIEKRPAQLSGGMNQRVALARALAQEPNMLLLDEPLGAVDNNTRNLLLIELQELKSELDLTVIMVTHNIEEAIFLSSRILYLDDEKSTITNQFKIDIPYPRSIVETMTSIEFNNYKKKILETYSS